MYYNIDISTLFLKYAYILQKIRSQFSFFLVIFEFSTLNSLRNDYFQLGSVNFSIICCPVLLNSYLRAKGLTSTHKNLEFICVFRTITFDEGGCWLWETSTLSVINNLNRKI